MKTNKIIGDWKMKDEMLKIKTQSFTLIERVSR